jgi:hypothetical protein
MSELAFPPPHMVWHEPLDDQNTRAIWTEYIAKHSANLDPFELDAAEVCNVDEFSRRFEIWVTSKSTKRVKVLMVWHAHFLSLACQQTLRRWLETKSYRCRVWFHVEMLNNVQSAIVSRCILKYVAGREHTISSLTISGEGQRVREFWNTVRNENELREQPSHLQYK